MSDENFEQVIFSNIDYKTGAYHKVIIDKINEIRALLEVAGVDLYYKDNYIKFNGITEKIYEGEFTFKQSSNPGFIFYKDKEYE